ncbi:hypothetical protein Mapa_007907 [Marchantia paleacea]|nr:hypothetical protein Mapa_007907 [Marchantia paleacea]
MRTTPESVRTYFQAKMRNLQKLQNKIIGSISALRMLASSPTDLSGCLDAVGSIASHGPVMQCRLFQHSAWNSAGECSHRRLKKARVIQ